MIINDLIKRDVHGNKAFFVLQLILKLNLKEKNHGNLSIVYPRCFNIPNQSICLNIFQTTSSYRSNLFFIT